MSKNSGQEKTEQATPKRIADARKKGQVARSRELSTAAVMLAAASALIFLGEGIAISLTDLLKNTLHYERAALLDINEPIALFRSSVSNALFSLLPFFAVVMTAAICAPAMTGGWSFSLQAIAFKAEKLNPLKGLKRIFAVRGLIELAKSMAKFGLVGAVAISFLSNLAGEFISLGTQPLTTALAHAAELATKALLIFSAPLLIVAGIDVPFQLWQHSKEMRMTRQEVRDESKETDGNPEMKGRIRSMQQEQANRRMMEQVPLADVVVTNPTHFAVALRYDQDSMGAPRVVAKGADHIAATIRALASANGVPVLEAPPLARALFRTTKLDAEIPARLYAAVAQVLTWVFQVRQARQHGVDQPPTPDVKFTDEAED